MDKRELEKRTKDFAKEVITFVAGFPKSKTADVIGYQLVKSGTSIGANYREANRAESKEDFIHKLSIVEKECSETQYWLEICTELTIGSKKTGQMLLDEVSELLAIFTSSRKTLRTAQ